MWTRVIRGKIPINTRKQKLAVSFVIVLTGMATIYPVAASTATYTCWNFSVLSGRLCKKSMNQKDAGLKLRVDLCSPAIFFLIAVSPKMQLIHALYSSFIIVNNPGVSRHSLRVLNNAVGLTWTDPL